MDFSSLAQAAEYSHVSRQAIYLAIRKGEIKAEKRLIGGKMQWIITQENLDAYRASKYIREKRVYNGKKLFDLSENRWSTLHAHKVLSQMLGRPYPLHHIYYLLRTGKLRADKCGAAWVITKESLLEIYEKELAKQSKIANE